jgi:hypothetical protein
VFFSIAGLALLDRVVSPIFSRLLEVLEAEYILMHRKALVTLGVTFVGLGSARLGKVLTTFIGGH